MCLVPENMGKRWQISWQKGGKFIAKIDKIMISP
jgi:hypothetical protein